ncbi:Malic acid transport protein 1 [Zalerion maritima]|uniref:Malic acid transport protein 1 n=1 Tax=Zalerion maritima TaxID=339359 RepID=A0AAD5RHD6_9PEZI|nr:Malic acid transport protein 1 [Zalerion maritima]
MAPRRRQNSQLPQPKSTHVEDHFLQDFLSQSFDPVEYLNSTLPPLSTTSSGTTSSGGPLALADLSNHAQTVVSQLNAHTTRLSSTLTQLTDDILRSGSRLAYQVELLRGEALSTSEALNERLSTDMVVFLPAKQPTTSSSTTETKATTEGAEPQYVSQLRTLTTVRARLDSVIKIFGDAMEFVFPPSELSTSSSFLSVSAPDLGTEKQSTEEKGQQILHKLRDEISALLADSKDPIQGIEKAAHRIEELKELSTVWNGTAEEKGRAKFLETLTKMVEDRHRELLREVELETKRTKQPEVDSSSRKGNTQADGDNRPYTSGLGLLNQLQKMRGGL